MRLSIVKQFEFEAAHFLPMHKGKCKNLHGHTYKLEVEVSGNVNKEGMIIDFSDLKSIVNEEAIQEYDHQNLNKHFSNPTAEVMIETIFKDIQEGLHSYKREHCNAFDFDDGLTLERVRLWETSNSYVECKA